MSRKITSKENENDGVVQPKYGAACSDVFERLNFHLD